MSLEGITFLDKVLQKKATKMLKIRLGKTCRLIGFPDFQNQIFKKLLIFENSNRHVKYIIIFLNFYKNPLINFHSFCIKKVMTILNFFIAILKVIFVFINLSKVLKMY